MSNLPLANLLLAGYRQYASYLLIVMAAMITACAGLSAVQVINATAKASYASASQPLIANVHWRIMSQQQRREIEKSDYAALRRQGFNQLVPVLRYMAEVQSADNRRFRLELVGIDAYAMLSLTQRPDNHTLSSASTNLGQQSPFWLPPFTTLIHTELAEKLDLQAGQQLTLSKQTKLPPLQLANSGLLAVELVIDIGQLQQASGKQHLSEILVVGELNQQQQSRIQAALPAGLALQSLNTGENAAQLTDSFHLNLLAMGLLMFVVCLFVVMNALQLLTHKRLDHFKIARQLGVSRPRLYHVLAVEILLLAAICAPAGAWLGWQLASLLATDVSLTLANLYDVRVGFNQGSMLNLMLSNFIACVIGGAVALSLPLWHLNKHLANTQLRPRGNNRIWLAGTALFLLLAACLELFSYGLISSFIILASILLAGCCLLIALLPMLLKGLAGQLSMRHAQLKWACANTNSLATNSKIAICAFFIALASNMGMNLMVDSFRQATQDWLQQRLVANYYLHTDEPQALGDFLATPATSHWQTLIRPRHTDTASTTTDSKSFKLLSYPIDAVYQQSLAMASAQADYWQAFVDGSGLLVNQQLAARLGLQLGDPLHYQNSRGQLFTQNLVGIYYDYGNPDAQALFPLAVKQALDLPAPQRYALHMNKQQIETLSTALAAVQVPAHIISAEELLGTAMQAFDRTFVITAALNIITLLVAALSLASSVWLISQDNRPQTALLRSFGIQAKIIALIRLGQFGLLTLLSAIIAIPFGIGLSWLLINLINWQAFQWSYPLVINPLLLVQILATSMLVVLTTVLLPLWWRSKQPLMDDIRCLS